MEDEVRLIESSGIKNLESFLKLQVELNQRMEDLRVKRELSQAQQEGEMVTVWMMDSWNAAESIRRKEESLVKHKKEKHEIDRRIVDTYEKIILWQMNRITYIVKKLQIIVNENPNKECPEEYRMKTYLLWVKDDVKLNTMQSEILESLGKKIRLTQSILQDKEDPSPERHPTIDSRSLDTEFENVRRKGYSIIEQYSIVDSDFADLVTQLLDLNGTNFEAVKVLEYVMQCRKDYLGMSETESEPANIDDLIASPNNYQSFICSLTQYIFNKYGKYQSRECSDPMIKLDQIYTAVENVLFPHVLGAIKTHITRSQDDTLMENQYKLFTGVDQYSMGIKKEFIDNCSFPHHKAIVQVKKISVACTPSQKLKYILLAAHEVVQFMNSRCDLEKRVPGADEFTDIWVYVILKSRLPGLFTTVALLRGYSNPRITHSESGYYLASFELAGEYIKRLTESALRELSITSQQNLYSSCEQLYFLPEAERCNKFAEKAGHLLTVVDTNVSLNGYKLLADLDSQLEPGRLLTTLLEEDQSSTVHGVLIKPNSTSNMNSRILENFISSQSRLLSDGFELRNNGKWTFVVRRTNQYNKCVDITNDGVIHRCRFIHLPSGNFSDYKELLRRYLALERFGYSERLEEHCQVSDFGVFHIDTIKRLTLALEERFMLEFNLLDARPVEEKIQDTVKDIQCRLLKLCFYSKILPIDGIYGTATMFSMRLFQNDFNEKHSGQFEDGLDINGICDFNTYLLLRQASDGNSVLKLAYLFIE